MPWTTDKDVERHTKKAKSSKRKRQWRHIANSMLERGKGEGAAIRAANGVIKNGGKRKKSRKLSRSHSRS